MNEEEFSYHEIPIRQELAPFGENSDDNGYMPPRRRKKVGADSEKIEGGLFVIFLIIFKTEKGYQMGKNGLKILLYMPLIKMICSMS